jgi:aspartyl-tRNA(Asn)/glutamyl-tRNA(Gln) amidotransferase subunit C
MSITRSDVEKVAHLARIAITDDAIAATTERLANVLAMVDQLQAIDTTGIEPLAHPLDTVQRLRADVVTEKDQRDLLLQNASATQDGLFLVPKVIE